MIREGSDRVEIEDHLNLQLQSSLTLARWDMGQRQYSTSSLLLY